MHDFTQSLDIFCERMKKGEKPNKEEILALLALDPDSEKAAYLRKKARAMAAEIAGNKGKVWSAFGIEHRPCSMNCKFCSFGEKWGIVKEEFDWSDDDVVKAAQISVSEGASWVTLRTNEFYSPEKLIDLAARIRAKIPGNYGLVINTGEFDQEQGEKFKKAGITGVYHTWRMGEGEATSFDPRDRLKTMRSVKDANLELYHMVEPLGPEHSNEEIADRILAGRNYNSSLGGVMARVNVKGTPFENSGEVDGKRLSQIIAICRVCGGKDTRDICAVPPLPECLEAGANTVTVEIGSIPRSDQTNQTTAWRGFDIRQAKKLLAECGYEA